MKLLGELVSLGRASQIVKENITPIDRTQILPINEALGRILAEDIIASHDVPPHDIACKDGYAIISSDTCSASATSPVKLVIMDTKVFAGHLPSDGLKPGCCIQVAPGAGIPAGADAVVAVEDVKAGAGNISINKPASRWRI
jgi:molybdopterin molybdotransferase